MVETQEKQKKEPHHGRNFRTARIWKNVTQKWLGEQMGMQQSEISNLEGEETIEKETLEKAAKILDVSMDFLETFIPEEAMQGVYSNNTFNNTVSDDATETITQGNVFDDQIINNQVPFSDVKKLFNELRKKDQELFDLKLAQLKKENDLLKECLNDSKK